MIIGIDIFILIKSMHIELTAIIATMQYLIFTVLILFDLFTRSLSQNNMNLPEKHSYKLEQIIC